jgi:hypothetical protein
MMRTQQETARVENASFWDFSGGQALIHGAARMRGSVIEHASIAKPSSRRENLPQCVQCHASEAVLSGVLGLDQDVEKVMVLGSTVVPLLLLAAVVVAPVVVGTGNVEKSVVVS